MSTADDYVRHATAAYERELRRQIERHGTPPSDPETAGRRAAALAVAGQAWDEHAGPFYDTDGARTALGGVTKQAVSQRVREGRLLGLRLAADATGRDRLVYPAWQFRGPVLRHLPRVLSTAGYDPERDTTGWTIAAWLTSPAPELDGLAPVAALEAGQLAATLAVAAEVRAMLGTDERTTSTPAAATS